MQKASSPETVVGSRTGWRSNKSKDSPPLLKKLFIFHCCTWAFSSRSFSCCGAQALYAWTLAVIAREFSSCSLKALEGLEVVGAQA